MAMDAGINAAVYLNTSTQDNDGTGRVTYRYGGI